jgi:hypothetical protein
MILPKRFFAVRLIRYSDQAKSTWKNWGGTTREIGKLHPPNETSYLWRASNADVSSSGPFSDFTGYDRILLFLSGSGLKLTFPTAAPTDRASSLQRGDPLPLRPPRHRPGQRLELHLAEGPRDGPRLPPPPLRPQPIPSFSSLLSTWQGSSGCQDRDRGDCRGIPA